MSDASALPDKIKELEYKKLQGETSWRAWALPAASGIVGAVSIFIAGLSFYTELRKDRQDHALACVNFAQNMLTVAQQQEAKIATLSASDQAGYVENLIAQFPPDAAAYLAQDLILDKVIESGDVLDAITSTLDTSSRKTGGGVDCPAVATPLGTLLHGT